MMGLLKAEVRRFESRRALRGLGISLLALCFLYGAYAYLQHPRLPKSVEVKRNELLAQVDAGKAASIGRCQRGFRQPPEFDIPPQTKDECEREWSEYLASTDKDRFHFSEIRKLFVSLGLPLAFLGWFIGATFIGADWHSGSLATTLTWEPRRFRLLLAKAIACAGMIFTIVYVLLTLLLVALLPVANFKGTFHGVDADWWTATALTAGRVALVSGMFGLIGFSIAALARNTAAAVGLAFGYFLIDGFARSTERLDPWLLVENLEGVVSSSLGLGAAYSTLQATGLLIVYSATAFVMAGILLIYRDVA